jgi:hypothetical protein
MRLRIFNFKSQFSNREFIELLSRSGKTHVELIFRAKGMTVTATKALCQAGYLALTRNQPANRMLIERTFERPNQTPPFSA